MKLHPLYFIKNWIGRYILAIILFTIGITILENTSAGMVFTIVGLGVILGQFITQIVFAIQNIEW
jgi:hypothetical protein